MGDSAEETKDEECYIGGRPHAPPSIRRGWEALPRGLRAYLLCHMGPWVFCTERWGEGDAEGAWAVVGKDGHVWACPVARMNHRISLEQQNGGIPGADRLCDDAAAPPLEQWKAGFPHIQVDAATGKEIQHFWRVGPADVYRIAHICETPAAVQMARDLTQPGRVQGIELLISAARRIKCIDEGHPDGLFAEVKQRYAALTKDDEEARELLEGIMETSYVQEE